MATDMFLGVGVGPRPGPGLRGHPAPRDPAHPTSPALRVFPSPPLGPGAPLRLPLPEPPRDRPNLGVPWGEGAAGCLVVRVEQVFPTAVMRFMGDAPLKGQSELDVLHTLLKVSLADFARCSLSCHVAHFPQPSTKVEGHGDGKPKGGYILRVGRGLGKGPQAFLQGVPPVLMCLVCGVGPGMASACDLAGPPPAVWGPRSHAGRVLLPSREADHRQHQRQAVSEPGLDLCPLGPRLCPCSRRGRSSRSPPQAFPPDTLPLVLSFTQWTESKHLEFLGLGQAIAAICFSLLVCKVAAAMRMSRFLVARDRSPVQTG